MVNYAKNKSHKLLIVLVIIIAVSSMITGCKAEKSTDTYEPYVTTRSRSLCLYANCNRKRETGSVYCSLHRRTDTERTTTKTTTTRKSTYVPRKTSKTTTKYDEYDVYDYVNPEDFYYDNYDDFFDYEDAEDYYYDHHS
ncbi:MAG: hypothetical protein Q4D35_01275 [Ruminococcus sp.]|nr:hypothetical protein [Ruminococcus sp.]